ncbi:MAG: ATP-binding protein [Candidatus Zixiibacteriota bacterium]
MLEANDRFRSIAGEPELERRLMVLDENTVITATASQRIAHIVRSLKNFARLDEADFQRTNIEEGIDTTLTPVHHEFKNRIEIITQYGNAPAILCFPNELNQVFMNFQVNASQAIHGKGSVTIATKSDTQRVIIEIEDTGVGVRKENLTKIFDQGIRDQGIRSRNGAGVYDRAQDYQEARRRHLARK